MKFGIITTLMTIEFYNERRIHFSLDSDIYETPLMAF